MKMLFIISEDWYFVSHRLELAKYLVEQGWEVAIACRVKHHRDTIENAGIKILEVPFHRESASVFDFLKDSIKLRKVIKTYKPTIIQCVALRSILAGWIALLFNKNAIVFNAVTGFGSLFSARLTSLRLIVIRRAVALAFKFIFSYGN